MLDSGKRLSLNWHVNRKSLRLFRTMLGIAVLSNLLFQKLLLFDLFFSSTGSIFSTKEELPFMSFRSFSLLDYCHQSWQMHLVLLLTFVLVILFILEKKPKLVALTTFFIWWNFCQFQSQFLNPSDILIGALLLISASLPTLKPHQKHSRTIDSSWAVKLLICQIAVIYLVIALVSIDLSWFNGSTLANLLHDKQLIRNTNGFQWIQESTASLISIAALFLFGIVFMGIMLSGRIKTARWVAVFGILIHSCITAIAMNNGDWLPACLAMSALFIPTEFWEKNAGENFEYIRPSDQSISIRVLVALLFFLVAQQNVYSLLNSDAPVSAVLKKFKVRKIMKLTYVPRLENASLLSQNWTILHNGSSKHYGQLYVCEKDSKEELFRSNIKRKLFENYSAFGLMKIRSTMFESQMDDFFHNYLTNWQTVFSNQKKLKFVYSYDGGGKVLAQHYKSYWHSNFTPPVYPYTYSGPVPKIEAGYGALGENGYETYQKEYADSRIMVFLPKKEKPVPVILFTHAFYGYDYRIYKSLMEHVASWGYGFAFVPYRSEHLSKNYDDNITKYSSVWEGFQDVVTTLSELVDSNQLVVAGHSFGGGIAGSLSVKAFVEKQWGRESGGVVLYSPGYMLDLEQEDLMRLPDHLYLQCQVYKTDSFTSAGMAWDYYENSDLPEKQKVMFEILEDEVDGYTYLANHFVPAHVGPSIFFDAYDYYGVFRPLDVFLKTVFEKDSLAREFLFGDSFEVRQMESHLKPMNVMQSYYPLQDESWYWAPCDDPANSRRSFCP